jgi:hypothetical protein
MDGPHKQPEGASRQAVGALMGALAGFAYAAREIFSNYGQSDQLPWVQAVGSTMIGGVVGLVLATILAGGDAEKENPAPTVSPAAEEAARAHFEPTRDETAKDRVKPGERVNGVEKDGI